MALEHPHAIDDALIGKYYALQVVHRPFNVLQCECIPLLHMIRFEIWRPLLNLGPGSLLLLIPPDRFDMHLYSIRDLNELLVIAF
ncbi:hypothetical protein BGX30_000820, partial [Mortierella sp. GBA39]